MKGVDVTSYTVHVKELGLLMMGQTGIKEGKVK